MKDTIKFPTQKILSKEEITNTITKWNEQLLELEQEETIKNDRNFPILKKNYFNIMDSFATGEVHHMFVSQFVERSNELLDDPYNDFYEILVYASLLLGLGPEILEKDHDLILLMLRIAIEGEINPHNYHFCLSYLLDKTFLDDLRGEFSTVSEQRIFGLDMVDLIQMYNITDKNQLSKIAQKELKEEKSREKKKSTSGKLFANTILSTKTIYDIIKEQALPFEDFTDERINNILELDRFYYDEKIKFFQFVQAADNIENVGSYRKIGDILNATELCINDESYLTTKNIAELYMSVMALAAESNAKGRK